MKPAEPPRRRRRWLRRVVIGIALLLVLAIVAIQVALWSNLPRSLVLNAIQQQLGLRAGASSVSTGWFGHTTLRDVKLALPMAESSLVEVPELRVEHSWLPALLLGRPMRIDVIEIHRPVLHVSQNPAGRWNIQEVIELVARTGGKEQAEQTAATAARPEIPAIRVIDATVHVVDQAGRRTVVSQLNVHGRPDPETPSLLWRYDVTIPRHLSLVGQMVPGADWQHQVKLDVRDLAPVLGPFTPGALAGAEFKGEWTGRIPPGQGVAGRLRLDRGTLGGGINATGVVEATQEGGAWVARPQRLKVDTGQALLPTALATAGSMRFDGKYLAAEGLVLELAGGHARLDARYNLDGRDATVAAEWTALALPGDLATMPGRMHQGSFTGTLSTRYDGGMNVSATLASKGSLNPARTWDARVEIAGEGKDWRHSSWRLDGKHLLFTGKKQVPLTGLTAVLRADGQQLTLDRIGLPQPDRLGGSGGYRFDTKGWSLNLGGREWPVPQIDDDTLEFRFDLAGDPQRVSLKELSFGIEDVRLKATGDYDRSRPPSEWLMVKVELAHRPDANAPQGIEAARNAWDQAAAPDPNTRIPTPAEAGAEAARPSLLRGRLNGFAEVKGTVSPLDLTIKGRLAGEDVHLRTRRIGDLRAELHGHAKPGVVNLWTDRLRLLGGEWALRAQYHLNEEQSTFELDVGGMQLAELREALGDFRMSGAVDANLRIDMPGLKSAAGRVRGTGKVTARNVVLPPSIFADSATATLKLDAGRVTIAPIELRRGAGAAGIGAVAFDVAGARRFDLKTQYLDAWPVAVPHILGTLTVDGRVDHATFWTGDAKATEPALRKFRLEAPEVYVSGSLVTPKVDAANAGHFKLDARMNGRVLEVRSLSGGFLGSKLSGSANVDFDKPLLMRAQLWLDDLDPERVSQLVPGIDRRLHGTFGLALNVAEARGRNALEPLMFEVRVNGYNARLGEMPIGDTLIRGYANLDDRWGLLRAVMEDVRHPTGNATPVAAAAAAADNAAAAANGDGDVGVNSIQVAGGNLDLWGRIVRNEDEAGIKGAVSFSTHLRIGVRALNLNDVLRAFDEKANPTVGRLDGDVVMYGTSQPRLPEGGELPAFVQQRLQRERALAATRPSTGPPTMLETVLRTMRGEVRMRLTETNLANVRFLAFLYDAMHLGMGPQTPTGKGDVEMRIEGNTLEVTRMYFRNRGVTAWAIATVHDVHDLPDSRLEGTVVGYASPVADIDLPGMQDLQKVLTAIQTGSTSIRVEGTVREPQMRVILFEEVGRSMKKILFGTPAPR